MIWPALCVHNLCTGRSDLVPRKFDLSLGHAPNISPGEVMDVLAVGSTNQKNFEVNKKSQALKVRKTVAAKIWKEKKDSL